MGTATLTRPGAGFGFRPIGPAHHHLRNAVIAMGVTVFGFLMVGAAVYWTHDQAVAIEQLSRFGAAYAERCDVDYPATAADQAKGLYLRSARLRRAIDRQLAALNVGASCEDVSRALRAVDFPMSSLRTVPPTGPPIILAPIPLTPEVP